MKKIIGYYRKCDLITMLGIMFSFLGIILVLKNHYTLSVLCLAVCGLCDAFDGPLARKYKYTKVQCIYGSELDSLSDVICFGVFPAVITSFIANVWYVNIICIFYLLCGVVRLAYFNTLMQTDQSKKGKFVGVPITTIAIVYPILFILIRLINFSLLSKIMPVILILLGISFILQIEIPKPNVPKIFDKIFNKYVINLIVFPCFLIIASEIFYKLNFNGLYGAIIDSCKTIVNYFGGFLLILVFVILLFLAITAIVKKSKISKIILLTMIIIILVINDIKFNIMGIPLELSDVNYLNPDNIKMMATASSSIGVWIFITILKAIFVLIIGTLFIFFDKKRPFNVEKLQNRIIVICSIVICMLLFAFLIFKNKNFIITHIYSTSNDEILSINSVSETYFKYGFIPGIYLNSLYKEDNKPDDYELDLVKEILDSSSSYEDGSWGKANVVFILSEAFSNLENIDEISFKQSLTPNINSYQNDDDKMVIDLLVPTYGGCSVNTEFEILTGASLSFWKSGYIPYTQYYNNVSGKYAPNIIKEFNNNGYETMYLTPWGRDSYKSEYVYSLFEVSKTIYGDQLNGKTKGYYYSDESLMLDIYNELKDTSEGNYKFIMSATGQNHYPFNHDLYESFDVEINKSNLSEEDNKILRNYAQGLYDADKELNNLYEMIQDLDIPTIIVFFGDHLPYTVNSLGNDAYLNSSYFNTDNENLNLLRIYTTKAVILANYEIETDDIDYLNASYLGTYILNKLDLEISNYFKFINYASTIVPVFNRNSIYQNGNIISLEQASDEVQEILNNYKFVQYGSFYDFAK